MSDQMVSGEAAIALAFTAYDKGRDVARKECAPPIIRRAVFPFTHGEVTMSFPSRLYPEEVEAVEEYLAIIVRQMRARAEADVIEPPEETELATVAPTPTSDAA